MKHLMKLSSLLLASLFAVGTMFTSCSEDEKTDPNAIAITSNSSEGGGTEKSWTVKFEGRNFDKITSLTLDGAAQTALTEAAWHTDGYLTEYGYWVKSATELYVRVPENAQLGTDVALVIQPGNVSSKLVMKPAIDFGDHVGIISNSSDNGGVEPSWTVTFTGANFTKITSLTLDGVAQTKLDASAWHTGEWEGLESYGYWVKSDTELYVRVPENAKLGENVTVVIQPGDVSATIVMKQPETPFDPNYIVIWHFNPNPDNAGFPSGVIGVSQEWGSPLTVATEGGIDDSQYGEITATVWEGKNMEYWWVADNWMYPLTSVAKADYVIKIDILLRNDIPANDTEVDVRLRFGDYSYNILPYLKINDKWTTGGVWKTITIDLADWEDLPDPTPDSGDRGIVYNILAEEENDAQKAEFALNNNFTGFCIDNVRFETKQ
ncbi:MAG: hypothetical protein EZS26_002730 [Candidatus Ordinivivax streblomastigis]|uniref:Surface glycan-binding protein B xyloglucan binding domain-containing protein n=1 Tax=Candidatus Ordinivivax streblomastigis TaxID=2540710 RepID=A0A5M8NY80_9BACT|nr:MAG: hypothetical protein EZS26_002730 [Candidatus Ordinivivax streblomastigis]